MNTEMIAGGASFAPRRCSLPDVPMPARSRPACLCTPFSTAARKIEEADVLMRRLSRLEQVRAVERVVRRDRHRPVAVLARAVDAGERLLVQHRLQAVTQRDPSQRRHHELVVVDRDVRLLEVRRHLELARRDFVVPRDDRHAELVELVLDFGDARLNPLRDAAEVVILELLAARRRCAHERAAAHDEVGAQREVVAVDEEVLLLRRRASCGRG